MKGLGGVLALGALFCTSAFGEIYGILDHAGCDSISGWVWDRSRENTPIDVSVYDMTRYPYTLVSTTLASAYRTDLAAYGNGQHAFSILTPSSLRDGNTHNISVYAGLDFPYSPQLVYGAQSLTCTSSTPGYNPYFTDPLTTVDATKWRQNGTLTAGAIRTYVVF